MDARRSPAFINAGVGSSWESKISRKRSQSSRFNSLLLPLDSLPSFLQEMRNRKRRHSLPGNGRGSLEQLLGMTRTHFRDNFSKIVKDQALGYRWEDDTKAIRA